MRERREKKWKLFLSEFNIEKFSLLEGKFGIFSVLEIR